MAKWHAKEFSAIKECQVVAACDVDKTKAQAFAAEHGIPNAYGDVDTMLKECPLDAVANVTPDRFHAPVSLQAIAAGKHIFCEKPLALNQAEALDMVRAAKMKGVINMVNFTYRNAPAIQMARALVDKGSLGKIVHVDMCYLQSWLVSTAWGDWRSNPSLTWKLSTQHGSQGALGDIGVHAVDFASFPVGKITHVNARLKAFSEFKGEELGGFRLDANDSALLQVEFANGALGTIHVTRWATGCLNTLQLRIFGTLGGLRIDLDRAQDRLEICTEADIHQATWREVVCPPTPKNYQRFIESIRTGINDQPDFQRGAEIQSVLDASFASNAKGISVEV